MNGYTAARPPVRREKSELLFSDEQSVFIHGLEDCSEYDTHYPTGQLKNRFFRKRLIFFLHDILETLAHVGKNQKPVEKK